MLIKAGERRVDEKKRILYEGLSFVIPKLKQLPDEIVFAVLTIKEGNGLDSYELCLHTHYQNTDDHACCEHDATLIISKDLLKKWTGLSGREIDESFDGQIHVGATYNMLAAMPRQIIVGNKTVTIVPGSRSKIDALNVCNTIIDGNYPLDS